MTKIAQGFIVFAGVVLLAGTASAAGLSKAQCDKLDREYQALQRKNDTGKATPADIKRMKQIDDQTNIYCS